MFGVAEATLALLLTRPLPLRRADEEVFINFDSSDIEKFVEYAKTHEPAVVISDTIEKALADDLSSVPQVKSVLIGTSDEGICVWIGIDDPTPEVRQRIYGKQLSLIVAFQECGFDFNIIPTGGRDIRDFVTDHALVTYERHV